MASSNRHWPSLFKSKPCNNQQWDHHPSLLSNSTCGRSSSPFSSGCEERSPEPKPRWNPKPEQIRILEAIFNSGMVNPPRDEIRRIRGQLQEYGQVGDANVFYWFQNRKSRSKHKQRSLQAKATATATATHHGSPPMAAASSSSSTSSEKASPKKPKSSCGGNSTSNTTTNSSGGGTSNVVVDQFGNSPTSVNQCTYFHQLVNNPPHHHHNPNEFVGHESMYFPLQQGGVVGPFSQGLGFGDGVAVGPTSDHGVGGFSSLLLGEVIGGGGGGGESKREDIEKLKFQQELSFLVSNPPNTTCTIPPSSPTVVTPSSGSLGQILGVGETGGMQGKSTVFIDNNIPIELPVGPLNVKEAFGEDAVLVYPTGHPVLTNEWGVTLHPLQNGAFYYLVRTTVAASPLLDKLDATPDLVAPEFPYQI